MTQDAPAQEPLVDRLDDGSKAADLAGNYAGFLSGLGGVDKTPVPSLGTPKAGGALGFIGAGGGITNVIAGYEKLRAGQTREGIQQIVQGTANTVGGAASAVGSLAPPRVDNAIQAAIAGKSGAVAALRLGKAAKVAGKLGPAAGVLAAGVDAFDAGAKYAQGDTTGATVSGIKSATGGLAAVAPNPVTLGLSLGATAADTGFSYADKISAERGYYGKGANGKNLSALDDAVLVREDARRSATEALHALHAGEGTTRVLSGIFGGVAGTSRYLVNGGYTLGRAGLGWLGNKLGIGR